MMPGGGGRRLLTTPHKASAAVQCSQRCYRGRHNRPSLSLFASVRTVFVLWMGSGWGIAGVQSSARESAAAKLGMLRAGVPDWKRVVVPQTPDVESSEMLEREENGWT